jgi:hypothetical protein
LVDILSFLTTHCSTAIEGIINAFPDEIAHQAEDPGLKYSTQAHVGLELSMRHAAGFFAFYVCRFFFSDMGMTLDKSTNRGSEWVLV